MRWYVYYIWSCICVFCYCVSLHDRTKNDGVLKLVHTLSWTVSATTFWFFDKISGSLKKQSFHGDLDFCIFPSLPALIFILK